jgi:hypothetical protein
MGVDHAQAGQQGEGCGADNLLIHGAAVVGEDAAYITSSASRATRHWRCIGTKDRARK